MEQKFEFDDLESVEFEESGIEVYQEENYNYSFED